MRLPLAAAVVFLAAASLLGGEAPRIPQAVNAVYESNLNKGAGSPLAGCDLSSAKGDVGAICTLDTGSEAELIISPDLAQKVCPGTHPSGYWVYTPFGQQGQVTVCDLTVAMAGRRVSVEAEVLPSWKQGPLAGVPLLQKLGDAFVLDFHDGKIFFVRYS